MAKNKENATPQSLPKRLSPVSESRKHQIADVIGKAFKDNKSHAVRDMSLQEALDYMKVSHEAMDSVGIQMIGLAIDDNAPAHHESFVLHYEPLVENDPNCATYSVELLRSILDVDKPRVIIYGDSLEELIAVNPASLALKAKYNTVMPPINICSPETNAMIKKLLSDLEADAARSKQHSNP